MSSTAKPLLLVALVLQGIIFKPVHAELDHVANPPKSCLQLPENVWKSLVSYYENRYQRDSAGLPDDYPGALFKMDVSRTTCFKWGDVWVVHVCGGFFDLAYLVERNFWTGEWIMRTSTGSLISIREDDRTTFLRVDTGEGCCDARWIQSTWYRKSEKNINEIASIPSAMKDYYRRRGLALQSEFKWDTAEGSKSRSLETSYWICEEKYLDKCKEKEPDIIFQAFPSTRSFRPKFSSSSNVGKFFARNLSKCNSSDILIRRGSCAARFIRGWIRDHFAANIVKTETGASGH